MKAKEHNCLNCETAKKPGWKGNCGTCPPLEDSGVRPRVREDASRALLTDAIKEVDRLRAENEKLTKAINDRGACMCGFLRVECKSHAAIRQERDKWHDSWKDLHNERQELRGVLGVPIPLGEGTVIQEFGPRYPLLESAKMIVKERDAEIIRLRARVAEIEAISAEYLEKTDRHIAILGPEFEENARLRTEVDQLKSEKSDIARCLLESAKRVSITADKSWDDSPAYWGGRMVAEVERLTKERDEALAKGKALEEENRELNREVFKWKP